MLLLVATTALGVRSALAPSGAAPLTARPSDSSRVVGPPVAQWGGFKVQKSDRLLIREAWERADAYRPGKPNWFTQKPKELVSLHEELLPTIEAMQPKEPPGLPGSGNETSLLGALLKSLSTGDLALTLCSKEPPVLTELRDWLVEVLPMEIAVLGLPEEQVRAPRGGVSLYQFSSSVHAGAHAVHACACHGRTAHPHQCLCRLCIQGRVLSTLVRAMDARRILDLGTFTGYSSIAMALAAAD
eukprot:946133-Prymnesium_polylepis.1